MPVRDKITFRRELDWKFGMFVALGPKKAGLALKRAHVVLAGGGGAHVGTLLGGSEGHDPVGNLL